MTFARTKIQPPRLRPGSLIDRPALEDTLASALQAQRLVLLCAAAGFGKTSLLARGAERLPQGTALAWIACDEDDSPALLFECLLAALEPFDLPWRTAPEALARAAAEADSRSRRVQVAAEVINALDACEVPHGVIVVDDLHRITHPVVYEFLDALLERFTQRWTLAVASRTEPPLALARLRAAEAVAEFRLQDLRFDDHEAIALGTSLGLPAEAAGRVARRAQGWPAGLRLAFNAHRSTQATPSSPDSHATDRALFDFLAAEVIGRLEPRLRDFLLSTSLLPELTAARSAALSGDLRAAEQIDEIERAGLFATRLDASEPTLRLHDLFRDALLSRLLRDHPDRVPALLRRAAATEPDPLRRVDWLVRAGDWDAAEPVLAASTETLITQGMAQDLHGLLQRFPAPRRESSPTLQWVRAMLGWVRWDWPTVIDASDAAARAYTAAGNTAAALAARSYHCIALAGANRGEAEAAVEALLREPGLQGPALARALTAAAWTSLRGDQRCIAPLMERLLDVLEQCDDLARWYECCPLPPMAGLPGLRRHLLRFIAGAQRRVPEHPTPLRGMCAVIQGWLHLWVGEFDRAEASAASAAADSRWLARPVNIDSYSRSLGAVLMALRGHAAQAQAAIMSLLAEVEAASPPGRPRTYLGLYLFVAMRIAAMVDNRPWLLELAGRLADDQMHGRGWLSPAQRASAPAYAALARDDLSEACRLWREVLAREHWSDLYGQVAEVRLRLADALLARDRPAAEAAAVLAPLFESVAASGEWGLILMAGPAPLRRLAAADWSGSLPDEQAHELRRWSRSATGLAAEPDTRAAADAAAPTERGMTVGLSARELEVLDRIAAGDSNKVIARALDLSPHTVKRHVANILDKLVLASRGQAAAWYRARDRSPGGGK